MKNKNNLNEELKIIKGNIWYSASEKQFYQVENDEQKPIKDPQPILNGIEKGIKERTPFLVSILEAFGISQELDKKKIETEDYFL
jgi:hypothetical protein